ncbi:putative transcriptional regulator, TetR family protein [Mycobacterium antarcticum]|uniref:TetR/AcrR family transcriptional regulator n=1 Tax=unclassified Mycolicibacterium TaxID=2636767 RepID=UPI00238BAA7D|nr:MULTISPECIES: TetR/AcrR family transcriptional regulator [unclassified Mycolicibacterium]BDX35002.1 putative transcriptional regulator, TetR family protein [Mycolicibacterium sp. TUM20985]GLP78229.1 putative transcriptional regulator, TetR family protein [Mycolicibacterium sp. TUM20983]
MHTGPLEGARPLPTTERGRRTRAAIIDAAATLMYERGVATTSLDEVLAAAGSGKSQLYHYFSNKNDLVGAVIERQLEWVLEEQQPYLDHTDSWKGIQEWAAQYLELHAPPEGPFACPLGTMAAELKNDPAFRPLLDDAFRRWEKPLADGLRAMRKRGELKRSADPDRLAAMVIAALQGGMLLARVRDDVTVLRDALSSAIAELHRWEAVRPASRLRS